MSVTSLLPRATQPGSSTALENLLAPVRRRLGELMRSEALERGDIEAAMHQLTEVAAATLKVERASVWSFSEDRSRLLCTDLYERSRGTHSSGVELSATATPNYFAALAHERSIAAHDARTDPRTAEFSAGYLTPLGITSMLDAPVFSSGRLTGVVCHEHIGPPREWEPWEELLAGTFGDFVSIVIGAAERAEQARALHAYRGHLEQLVEERTGELKASEARFQLLFEAAPVALVMSRASDHTVTAANARAAAMFAVDRSQVVGQHAPDFWVDSGQRTAVLRALSATGSVASFETQLKDTTGKVFWTDISARVVQLGSERAVMFGIRDISAQKSAEEQLRALAATDSLTGVLNRRRVFEVAAEEVDRAQRYERPLALAMIDLDLFKSVNDRFGHAVGDVALREVARTVRESVRKGDQLGRYGGEEFLLVMPETSLEAARAVLERVRAAVQRIAMEPQVALSVSSGVVTLRKDEKLEPVLIRADAALYSAKQAGRNRVVSG
ncbi:MAG: diguanylate cyclase [Archangiaceae bacterium]|nr:diguanylate cyclase [Archangiaceae bacterium]